MLLVQSKFCLNILINTSEINMSDSRIRRLIEKDNGYNDALAYSKKLNFETMKSDWFESKEKFDFAERLKREMKSVAEELHLANVEFKQSRNFRLKQLYNFETRKLEDELAAIGLAVSRSHN